MCSYQLCNEAMKPPKRLCQVETKHSALKDKLVDYFERKKYQQEGQTITEDQNNVPDNNPDSVLDNSHGRIPGDRHNSPKTLMPFPTSYLCVAGFSTLTATNCGLNWAQATHFPQMSITHCREKSSGLTLMQHELHFSCTFYVLAVYRILKTILNLTMATSVRPKDVRRVVGAMLGRC